MSSNQQRNDKTLGCAACGERFVFSAGEQELLAVRGVQLEPQVCPHCARAGRRATRTA